MLRQCPGAPVYSQPGNAPMKRQVKKHTNTYKKMGEPLHRSVLPFFIYIIIRMSSPIAAWAEYKLHSS